MSKPGSSSSSMMAMVWDDGVESVFLTSDVSDAECRLFESKLTELLCSPCSSVQLGLLEITCDSVGMDETLKTT